MRDSSWDTYFMGIADAVSKKSHCLSHQFGAIAVKDRVVLSTGYNGPPRAYPHCGVMQNPNIVLDPKMQCPRHAIGYKSGEGLDVCPAVHAELNALIQAARFGVCLNGATLYITSPTPCRECAKAIVNAGIIEVVYSNETRYPDIGLTGYDILEKCGVNLRFFKQ